MSKGTPKNGGTPADDPPNKNGGNGRTIDGKFAPGNAGGPGRPKSARSAVMEHAWNENLTPKRAHRIVRAILLAAIKGEPWACKEVSDRSMGKPKESLELTGEFTLAEFYRALAPKLLAS